MLLFIHTAFQKVGDLVKFQYISCYCLSRISFRLFPVFLYFNTSHVTVYLCRMAGMRSLQKYFNTSHVTVYLISGSLQLYSFGISIHLMLLFIFTENSRQIASTTISIHLMLLFIRSCY